MVTPHYYHLMSILNSHYGGNKENMIKLPKAKISHQRSKKKKKAMNTLKEYHSKL